MTKNIAVSVLFCIFLHLVSLPARVWFFPTFWLWWSASLLMFPSCVQSSAPPQCIQAVSVPCLIVGLSVILSVTCDLDGVFQCIPRPHADFFLIILWFIKSYFWLKPGFCVWVRLPSWNVWPSANHLLKGAQDLFRNPNLNVKDHRQRKKLKTCKTMAWSWSWKNIHWAIGKELLTETTRAALRFDIGTNARNTVWRNIFLVSTAQECDSWCNQASEGAAAVQWALCTSNCIWITAWFQNRVLTKSEAQP